MSHEYLCQMASQSHNPSGFLSVSERQDRQTDDGTATSAMPPKIKKKQEPVESWSQEADFFLCGVFDRSPLQ